MTVDGSILITMRPLVHVEKSDDSFDEEIIPRLNAGIARLRENGLGPTIGLIIQNESETWGDLLGDKVDLLAEVPIFLQAYIRKHGFDVPTSPQVQSSINETYNEMLWLIRENVETNYLRGN